MHEIFPPQQARRLQQAIDRESITTETRNDVLSGSRTTPLAEDIADLKGDAAVAADFFTGNYFGLLRQYGNRLATLIGKRQAKEILDILTETDPARHLEILNRLAARARTRPERDRYLTALIELRGSMQRRRRLGLPEIAVGIQQQDRENRR